MNKKTSSRTLITSIIFLSLYFLFPIIASRLLGYNLFFPIALLVTAVISLLSLYFWFYFDSKAIQQPRKIPGIFIFLFPFVTVPWYLVASRGWIKGVVYSFIFLTLTFSVFITTSRYLDRSYIGRLSQRLTTVVCSNSAYTRKDESNTQCNKRVKKIATHCVSDEMDKAYEEQPAFYNDIYYCTIIKATNSLEKLNKDLAKFYCKKAKLDGKGETCLHNLKPLTYQCYYHKNRKSLHIELLLYMLHCIDQQKNKLSKSFIS